MRYAILYVSTNVFPEPGTDATLMLPSVCVIASVCSFVALSGMFIVLFTCKYLVYLWYFSINSIHLFKCIYIPSLLNQHYLLYLTGMDILKSRDLLPCAYACFQYRFLIHFIIGLCVFLFKYAHHL